MRAANKILTLLLVLLISGSIFAQEKDGEKEEKKFDPGKFIIDHIGDAYEWHIATFGSFHLSIPLPVIVYSKNTKKLSVFMSSKFHHGHEAYNGFQISESKDNKGKIVEVMSDGTEVRPVDLSITKNVLALFISIAIMLIMFLSVAKAYKRKPNSAPSGLQSLFEPLIIFVRDDIAKPSIGEKKYERYMPFLLSVFFFILLNNLLGLVPIFPGGANLTGNISVTMVLALLTFLTTILTANKNYWMHIFWPPVPVFLKYPIMFIIEAIGMIIKPFVLMVRLFANITAGHIIALGFFSLIFIFGSINTFAGYGVSVVSIIFTVFMTMLELLVAFIQAYVFTLLSAIYFGMATEEHHAKH